MEAEITSKSVEELKEYLVEKINLEVAETLSNNGIDGAVLLQMKERHIQELIPHMGNRLRLLQLVETATKGMIKLIKQNKNNHF